MTAPRKIRLIVRLIKGLQVPKAQALLATTSKRACKPILKVLNSAVANATRDGVWTVDRLVISHIAADEGPMMRRYQAGAMGRAMPIQKKMTHLEIQLDAKKERSKPNGA